MKRGVFDARFKASVSLLLIFFVCQYLFRISSWAGGLCSTSLRNGEDSQAESHPYSEGTVYGFPLPFIGIGYEGCFSDRQLMTRLFYPFLLVDIIALVGIGALPYILPPLWRRIRHRKP
jgi:hypothetical protein